MSRAKKNHASDGSEQNRPIDEGDDQNISQTDNLLDDEEKNSEQDGSQEMTDLQDRYLRTLAEYENFRKRTQKEKQALYADAVVDVAKEWLDVVDNIERAICHCRELNDSSSAKVVEGVEMIYRQAQEVMERLGIQEIPCDQGQCFDPDRHEAVMHVEDDELDEHCIAEVFKKGYQTKDRIIRYSVVKVAN